MKIHLQNTLTGEKEEFKAIKEGFVSMYNCGPTVYNYAHIGNLRSYVFADTLRRMFEYNGYKVNQVINVTDIGHLSSDNDDGEDKMTKALKREGKPLTLTAMREVADFYFAEFKKDLTALNVELPEHFPFASDHIKEDIDLVSKLFEKGFTYTISDGIYFDTSKFPEYGKLGNIKKTDDTESRIGLNQEKKNSRDFAVWKFNSELGYEAPFGKGFPGWHIECSAMSVKYLGPEFDIHTGGIDHIPVHHNNEIAQSVCAGDPYAKYWMHNAHLNMAGENGSEKMAKSGENFITLKTLKERGIDPVALRYVFLTASYSSPLQFSWQTLEGADSALKKIRIKIQSIKDLGEVKETEFRNLINDDLDTPKALALVWDIIKDDNVSPADKKATILSFDKVLGLELDKVETFEVPEEVQNLLKERDLARANKDFTKSDEIREKIENLGFEVKDTAEGSTVSPQ
ncbi:MAG: cysteine--tRNA ligase [Parcubacteria group bacterium]